MTQQQTLDAGFGNLLSDWRKKRRFSQLSFGLFANVSARHVSFLESGRSRPSREMVLKLADCLDMPKSEINRALLLAGFSPAYLTRQANDADLAPIHRALSLLLDNHMPYPAISIDRLWNIKAGNAAAMKLLIDAGFGGHSNLIEAVCAHSPQQSTIINWHEAIGLLLTRLQAELLNGGDDEELAILTGKLAAHFKLYDNNEPIDRAQAVIPTRFALEGKIISVFSTIASFGSVQDVVLDDLKVELMFPLDDISKAYFVERNEFAP